MHVPGLLQHPGRDVRRGQRRDRAERGEDGPVAAPGQRHGDPGRAVPAHRHRADVNTLPAQLVQHELAGRVGADRGDQRHPDAEPGRGHRGDGRRSADDQGDRVHQLLLLAERGGHILAEDQYVRIAVPDHDQVRR